MDIRCPSADEMGSSPPSFPPSKARRVFSRGRFGAWKYEVSNQDHSFMQGVEIVNRLVCDTPEVTITDPNLANSGVFLQAERTTR